MLKFYSRSMGWDTENIFPPPFLFPRAVSLLIITSSSQIRALNADLIVYSKNKDLFLQNVS